MWGPGEGEARGAGENIAECFCRPLLEDCAGVLTSGVRTLAVVTDLEDMFLSVRAFSLGMVRGEFCKVPLTSPAAFATSDS